LKSILGLTLGTLAIGFAGIWVRLSHIGPLGTGLWRLTIAAMVVFLWGLLFDHESLKNIFKEDNKKWLKITIFAGFGLGADLALWHIALHKTSVAMATLFTNFAPIFMLMGSALFLGEKIKKKALWGIGLCILGIVFLAQRNSDVHSEVTWLGNGIALLSAVFYACYLLLIRKARAVGIKPIFNLGVLSFSGALFLLCVTALFEPQSLYPQGRQTWIILISLALTAQVLGQGLISACLSKVANDLSSAILCLQAVFAAIAAYFILNQSLSGFQIVGGLLVICGIFVVRVKRA
jgi:drug/metabolite transporter (DMT)-like permease